ncbi:GntR family transcriptional regulator [Bradyrhizobium sp. Leo121]|uniref:GntR family transcriptional regulator n=1 Tax=Bradyrhizobium sp. Leo121 TaxID=1571195 RepID=UPI00102A2DAC|nr:GntR family transcriptional regulator [Bradyrhizobium sp. Leo121]RZN31436.1 GntR family transcriptional regulator [Bradyrhizobium sp. Leo121]
MTSKHHPVASNGASATSASLVYELLRKDVLYGAFPPDSKLGIDSLSERYGVGSIPIREALNRLSAEGFVAKEDQKGFFVPAVSMDELWELTRTRCLLHNIAVPESLDHGDTAWEERLVLAAHYLFKTPRQSTGSIKLNPEWDARHRAFHLAVIDGSPSRWIRDFHANLFDYADRYRHQYISAETHVGSRDVEEEHREILDAAISRSTERLIELLNDHTRRTTEIIARSMPEQLRPKHGPTKKQATRLGRPSAG